MCGIFGLVIPRGRRLEAAPIRAAVQRLFQLSEPRGKEASGLLIAYQRVDLLKRPLKPSVFLASSDFQQFFTLTIGSIGQGSFTTLLRPLVIIGHCRLVTNGAEVLAANNQPVRAGEIIGVHNGIITNEAFLEEKYAPVQRQGTLDSELIFAIIDHLSSTTGDLQVAVTQLFSELRGTASIACLHTLQSLVLATNNGSLYFSHDLEQGSLVFTSERYSLEQYLKHPLMPTRAGVQQLPAGTGMLIDLPSGRHHTLDLTKGTTVDVPYPRHRVQRQAMVIEPTLEQRLLALRRCSRCILPETYPFIVLDEDNVCNYCRQYQPPKLTGRQSLEAELSSYRRGDGRPDCIVAFSGGRDSSYGLHLLKTEFGMNPIAFSYDWGMVTPIARRNQARMCGQLGVEHILRAADIPAKRRYLRKNILAWLKRPHLGMVPLFMAGDKFFYQIARELRHELRIPLVVFCAGNPLERTDFKGGFAGIRESLHGQRLFAYSLPNKVQIGLYYALQYLRNPSYFNESFAESMRAFFSTFIARDDFLYLYHHLPWDEEEINRTLIDEYDWEIAEHTNNTWRIGDGYTSFINHLYYTIAGFSEFDVFRSQQVRAGLLTRDQAIALVNTDNRVDRQELHEFFNLVGLDLEEVLARIDSIPKLY